MELLAPLVFVIVSLVAGAILKYGLKRTVLPYTVGLFAFGLIIGLLDRAGVYADGSVFKASIDFAGNINPDLILYLFLPILISTRPMNWMPIFSARPCSMPRCSRCRGWW